MYIEVLVLLKSGNKIIGNVLSRIHGTWYSGNTNDDGGDYAIYATTNSIVKENIISDSNINASGAAIYVAKNSIVSDNSVRNCNGSGVNVEFALKNNQETFSLMTSLYKTIHYTVLQMRGQFIRILLALIFIQATIS